MTTTILEELGVKTPNLNTTMLRRGPNTYDPDWIPVEEWQEWTEFNYENLVFWNERTLETFLAKCVFPIINKALSAAKFFRGDEERLYLSPGSWTGHADWCLVSHNRVKDNGTYIDMMPGDTKLSSKWRPEMETSHDPRTEWKYPLSQVQDYAARVGCRYGYIITDKHLVVLCFYQNISH